MNLFFDTSSLFKLYHREEGTADILKFFEQNSIKQIFVASITQVEFASAIWKKVRKGELEVHLAQNVISNFEKDRVKFNTVKDDEVIKLKAKNLLSKYWNEGLRTLDALQLASLIDCKLTIDVFFTSDKVLSNIAESEGISIFK